MIICDNWGVCGPGGGGGNNQRRKLEVAAGKPDRAGEKEPRFANSERDKILLFPHVGA